VPALPWCDCILVSHCSPERLADARSLARRTGAVVAASAPACTRLELDGLPARQVRAVLPGDLLSVAGFDIEVLEGARGEGSLGFRVRAGLISMITGSARARAPGARADILLAGARGGRARIARTLRLVRPRLVVACGSPAPRIPPWRDLPAPSLARLFAHAIRASGIAARLFVPELLRETDIRALL
jgi:hypothetical protein